MQRTLFDRTIDLGDAWEERSVYRFFLRAPEDAASDESDEFRPNLVVVREPQAGRSLEQCAEQHRKAMGAQLENVALLREGRTQVASLPAFEQQYLVSLPDPIPRLMQWLVAVAQDGYCYFFFATTPQARFEADRREILALIQSLR